MKRKILVVDDEPDLLDLLAHHLGGAGFEVMRAARGFEGLDLASRTPPDLMLLDVMLPDLLGTEVVKHGAGFAWTGPGTRSWRPENRSI